MKKFIPFLLLILFVFLVQSCKKDIKKHTKNTVITDSIPNEDIEETGEGTEENISDEPDAITYPKTGNKIADFLPKSGTYEVEYEAEGDLNNDGLADIAAVIKYKQSKTSERPILILLQNEDKSYRLDKVSNTAMPLEYNDYDFKLYDTEEIRIEKGELQINLYGYGPSGSFLSTLKYIKNDLVLNTLEAHFSGAGGRTVLFYDFEKGEITSSETNTIDKDEPTTSETIKVKMKPYLFENTSITEFFNDDHKS